MPALNNQTFGARHDRTDKRLTLRVSYRREPRKTMNNTATFELPATPPVSSTRLLGEHRTPVNRDAANILRRVKPSTLKTEWTKADEGASRWAGLISKCPRCGDRAYEHGNCFGCGKPLGVGDGERRSPNNVIGDHSAKSNP